jgi:transcriptional regulator with XRE-family HTH domain
MRDQENITPIDQFVIDFIRDLRMKKNLSQQGLADILQVSKSYISSIESTNSRAKYNLRYVNILADYFDMSPREFLPFKPVSLEFTNKSKQAAQKSLRKKITKKATRKN